MANHVFMELLCAQEHGHAGIGFLLVPVKGNCTVTEHRDILYNLCAASVEDCCVAVGNVVGHENFVSASRMNSAIVVFLNDVEKVRKLTQNGIVGNNETILVSPLSSPDKKVMLCNVPPFISDEAIGKGLSRYGRMVSPIKKTPLGCKSPLTLSVLNVVKLDILPGPALRGRVPPVFLSDRGGTRPPGAPGAAAASDLTESEPQAQPAPQKPTGATPAPENPRSARPDRKKPWSTEKSSVGSGAVLEPPALTEAGTEVQGDRMETPGHYTSAGGGGRRGHGG
ncbi:hypothetical protein QTP70_007495 [Hemibagrus guttatus]|uniref:Uncharacterized protein n=1 Tax=Hemibagrus guttatus TaxID=175788 RepID=A0AAE0R2J4_9TELE|nr:hypothetical protein QTP70_007495 [Hemibagrus guttatus]